MNNLQIKPTDKQKELLVKYISENLEKSKHLTLFLEYLYKTNNNENTQKIYTVTESCILFDLNDLDDATFWKINDYVISCVQEKKHNDTVNLLEQEIQLSKKMFEQSVNQTLKNSPLVQSNNISEYEKLRLSAINLTHHQKYQQF